MFIASGRWIGGGDRGIFGTRVREGLRTQIEGINTDSFLSN